MAENVQTGEIWQWICGWENSTDLTSFKDFNWDSRDQVLNNTCLIDAFVAAQQTTSILILSAILLVLGFCTNHRTRAESKYLIRYPGHCLKWLVTLVLLIVLLASVGEGVLTDNTYRANDFATQPHLYIAPVTAFLGLSLTLVYYHTMEVWNAPRMALPLIAYWVTSMAAEASQLINLLYRQKDGTLRGGDDSVSLVGLMKFDLVLCRLILYGMLLLMDLNVVRKKIFKWCRKSQDSYKTLLLTTTDEDLKEDNKMLFAQDYVSLPSELTFWWTNWLLALGYNRALEITDLGSLPVKHETKVNHVKFSKAFRAEQKEKSKVGKPPSLWKVYLRVYGWHLIGASIYRMVHDMFCLIGPLCVGGITLYVANIIYAAPDEDLPEPGFVTFSEFFSNGFVLVITMFLTTSATVVFDQLQSNYVQHQGFHVYTSLQAMIYEKSLRLSTYATTGGQMTMGQITNHMSMDARKMYHMFEEFNLLWTTPIQLLATLLLLYFNMGYSALVGASVFLVALPIQYLVFRGLSNIQQEKMEHSDERLKQTNELLNGIKLLKLYGWEGEYSKAVDAVRNKELWAMVKDKWIIVALIFINNSAPMMMAVVAFAFYQLIENKALTPDIAFSSLALFNQLGTALFLMPMVMSTTVNAMVSTKRLQDFLTAPEVEGREDEEEEGKEDEKPAIAFKQPGGALVSDNCNGTTTASEERANGLSINLDIDDINSNSVSFSSGDKVSLDVAVKIDHGIFCWDQESKDTTLDDINVEIPAGKLTIIVGQVGSGKSSLLSAVLGEMTTLKGSVNINSNKNTVAYAAQKAWLLNASLKENILFGQDMDYKRYKKCIAASSLQDDLDVLPAGDRTEIGEKGINLSGGQKQRVSVARALYSGRDIVVLDDPLSALDVHVGGHLFQEGIMGMLVKNKQTVILVTHQLQYLKYADLAIVMKDGKIQHQGTLSEIRTRDPDLYNTWQGSIHQDMDSEESTSEEGEVLESPRLKEERDALKRQVSRQMSEEANSRSSTPSSDVANLIEEEERATGSVSYEVYHYYIKNMGYGFVLLVVMWIVLTACFDVSNNFWLTAWTEAGLQNDTRNTNDYVAGYAGLSIASRVSEGFGFATLFMASILGARKIHAKMFHNIIRAPLRFFDTTPIGRILNRFSSDTADIDMNLAGSLYSVLGASMKCLAAIVVNTIIIPYFIGVALPVAVCYYFIQKYFIPTTRELQRLSSISRSPVYAYFSETLNGLSTIRAFKAEQRFYNNIVKKINNNLIVTMYAQTVNRWLELRLNFIGAFIVLLAGISTVVGALYAGISPSMVGLAITYALEVSGYLTCLVHSSTWVEIQMNAVERVKHYSTILTEPYEGIEPPSEWPNKGEIHMEDISARYAADLDPVLNKVNVVFPAGHKIGICGRTGSGKSSLTLSLFRIIDTFEGRITVDGVDISTVPLTTLRQRLSIIPQDPVLFTGTIRYNLDPLGSCTSDQELWDALEVAQLKTLVSDLDNGLDSKVAEGGENYSVGQRQLFCIARAFLRKSRILVMDEATASIDMETDKILQKIVATAFADRTVLTIAHRMATIMDSDTILVLGDGKVVECDSPQNLLAEEGSVFASLVNGK